jgi:hypothetical protein
MKYARPERRLCCRARILGEKLAVWVEEWPAQAPGSTLYRHLLGLRLSDNETWIGVGLRLGAPIIRQHTGIYGSPVEVDVYHGLSCYRSAGRHSHRSLANDALSRRHPR